LIPVTSFAGKTVAVFGLGGSGLASCHALKAGDAEVIAGDDNADNVAKAVQAGFTTGNGLGLGLPGVRRLMDDFEISSVVGKGTSVTARKWMA